MPSSEPKSDPVSPFVHQVLAVYAEALPQVRFPDVDLTLLQGSAQELCAAQLEVERVEVQLEAARSRVRAQSELLTTLAERALAYARVFAEGDATVSERVGAVGRGKPKQLVEGAAPKKRGRPRKADHDASLFGVTEAPSMEAAVGSAA